MQKGQDKIANGYKLNELDQWAGTWSRGGTPDGLAHCNPQRQPKVRPRDVCIYFIREGKVRAPKAAKALQKRCDAPTD